MFGQVQVRVALAVTLSLVIQAVCLAGPAEDQYAVAAGHYAKGRWQLAADEMQRFLTSFPNHPQAVEAKFFLGEALMQLGKVQQAREQFEAMSGSPPEPGIEG